MLSSSSPSHRPPYGPWGSRNGRVVPMRSFPELTVSRPVSTCTTEYVPETSPVPEDSEVDSRNRCARSGPVEAAAMRSSNEPSVGGRTPRPV
ncbi:hypothetical protein [Kocuria rosea]|uniref:hypothetical protein n=1 Tax=Kocuria rosea TaxID=1275 RepID=UPI0011A63100|nr:hypothetical protein [Kocuria rosea]